MARGDKLLGTGGKAAKEKEEEVHKEILSRITTKCTGTRMSGQFSNESQLVRVR